VLSFKKHKTGAWKVCHPLNTSLAHELFMNMYVRLYVHWYYYVQCSRHSFKLLKQYLTNMEISAFKYGSQDGSGGQH
jgi:hypothetical protein